VLHPGDGEALNMTYHTGAPERAPAQRPRVESSTGGGGTAFLEETISTEILLLGCFPGGGPSAIAGASVTFSSRTIEREKVAVFPWHGGGKKREKKREKREKEREKKRKKKEKKKRKKRKKKRKEEKKEEEKIGRKTRKGDNEAYYSYQK
jgi:hypothetical protein